MKSIQERSDQTDRMAFCADIDQNKSLRIYYSLHISRWVTALSPAAIFFVAVSFDWRYTIYKIEEQAITASRKVKNTAFRKVV